MRLQFFLIISIFTIVGFGCNSDSGTGTDDEITFANNVEPLLKANCTSCHSGSNASAGLNLESWSSLIAGSDHGEVIIPFDPENSLLVEMLSKLAGGNHPSDVNAGTLSDDQVSTISKWILEGAKNENGLTPYENAANLLYVCNQNAASVSVIDTDANLVIRNVNLQSLGFSPTSKPHHIAVEPDGSAWYVSLIDENTVLKFNRDNDRVGQATVSIPALLTAHSNGNLYVSRFMQSPGDIPQQLGVIERSSMTAQTDIPVGRPIPHALASSRDGKYVYTCSLPESQIIVIDAATGDVDEWLSLGESKGPVQLAVSPDDNTLIVSGQISDQMFVIDVSDPANRSVRETISVNKQPWHPVFTPDGSRVYVGNLGANTVTVINMADFSTNIIGSGTGLDGLAQPHGIAMAKDGSHVYVSCRNVSKTYKPRYDFGDNEDAGTVVVINTATNLIEKVIEIGAFGSGMAL